MLWLPCVTSIFSLPYSTVWVSSFLIFVTRSWRTSRDSSFFTSDVRSFSAWKLTSSLPILSSNDSMLKLSAPPCGLLRDLIPLIVLSSGSVQGGHHVGVVPPPHDDRSIDVAFHEIHDYFLADPRDVDRSPLRTRPKRGNAHPAGAVDVILALAVPVELHLHRSEEHT